jgi:drug/metabolite transporter (DMT)-like permease
MADAARIGRARADSVLPVGAFAPNAVGVTRGGPEVRRAYAYTAFVVLSWALSMPTTKALLNAEREGVALTPLQVAFWAIGVGWVSLLLVLVGRKRLRHVPAVAARGWIVLFAMGFFGWAGYVVALNIAFTKLPLPDAIVINYLHPVFVVIFQGAAFASVVRLISGPSPVSEVQARPPRTWMALGLIACLLGVAVIATGGRLLSLGETASSAGVAAALFAAFAWGVYSNLGRFVTVKPGRAVVGMGDVQTWVAMTFALVMMGAMLVMRGSAAPPVGYTTALFLAGKGPLYVDAWYLIAGLGTVAYMGGYTLWLVALDIARREGEAHKLPALTYLVPVLSVALGWLLLRETFGEGFWQGAALIAAGNLTIVLSRPREARG